jgi:hypothetical protein
MWGPNTVPRGRERPFAERKATIRNVWNRRFPRVFTGGRGVGRCWTTRSVAESVPTRSVGTRWTWSGLRNAFGREEILFEKVITDSPLLSFLGHPDRSNVVRGNEKRQEGWGRPGLVVRDAPIKRGTPISPVAWDLRRNSLAWGEIRDREWDSFLLYPSHFASFCLISRVANRHVWRSSRESISRTWLFQCTGHFDPCAGARRF